MIRFFPVKKSRTFSTLRLILTQAMAYTIARSSKRIFAVSYTKNSRASAACVP